MQVTYSLNDIKEAATAIWHEESMYKVWAFHGEMGTGKTTFIHSLCETLGLASSFGSPTYSIINEYKTEQVGIVYHMDWYRLKDEEEALQAGVEDALFSGKVCFIEWPEKAERLLPENTLHLFIDVLDKETRKIIVTKPATD